MTAPNFSGVGEEDFRFRSPVPVWAAFVLSTAVSGGLDETATAAAAAAAAAAAVEVVKGLVRGVTNPEPYKWEQSQWEVGGSSGAWRNTAAAAAAAAELRYEGPRSGCRGANAPDGGATGKVGGEADDEDEGSSSPDFSLGDSGAAFSKPEV